MWFYILNKVWKPKKLNLKKILKTYKWKKNKIKKIIDNVALTALLKNYILSEKKIRWVFKLIRFYTKYCSIKKLHLKKKYTTYSTIVVLKLTKKQLFSTVMKFNKVLVSKSNGIFLKKLNIEEKSKKKDIKLYLINLKKTEEFLKKHHNKNILINIISCNAIVFKLNKSIRLIFKNYDYNYIFSPRISFSLKKFKKVKAIKRKLRKTYTLVN